MRRGGGRLRLLWLLAAVVALACDRLLTEPTPGITEIEVRFAVYEGPPGGTEEAFARVSHVSLTFTRPDDSTRDTVIAVSSEDGLIRAGIQLETEERIDSLGIDARLGYGTTAAPTWLFQGSTEVRIESGVPTAAEIDLTPVAAAVAAAPTAVVIPNVGETAQMTSAVLFASEDTITGLSGTWLSEDPSIVSVTPEGVATAQQIGQTQLVVGVVGYDALADTVTATVSSIADGTVTPADSTVFRGESVQYQVVWQDALGNDLTGRTATWETTDSAVATIDASGLASTAAAGGVTVSATAEGVTASTSLTVLEPIASIDVSPDPATVVEGSTVQLTGTPLDGLGNPVTGRTLAWSTGDGGVATVDQTGLVAGVSAGSVTISASAEGVTGAATVDVLSSGVVTWVNASGGNWSDPANWSTGVVPGPTDSVEISAAGTYSVTVDVSPTIASLEIGGASATPLVESVGQSITVGGPVSVLDGAFLALDAGTTLSASQMTAASGASVILSASSITTTTALDVLGALGVYATSTVDGSINIAPGGTVSIEGDVATPATLTLDSDLWNEGLLSLTQIGDGGPASLLIPGGTLRNQGTGTVQVDDPFGTVMHMISAQIDNQGTFVVNDSLTIDAPDVTHLNSGTITTTLDVTWELGTGSLTNTASATLDPQAGFLFVNAAGGTVTTEGAVSTGLDAGLWLDGGTLDYTGGTWSGSGGVVVANGAVTLSTPLTLPILLGLQNADVTGAALTIIGQLENLDVSTASVGVDIDNQGIIRTGSGELSLNGALVQNGTIEVISASTASALTVANGFTNNGSIELTNDLEFSGTPASLTVTTGTLANAPTGSITTFGGSGGGARELVAPIVNEGQITVDWGVEISGSLTFSGPGAMAVNAATTVTGSLGSPASAATTVSGTGSSLAVSGLDVDGATFDNVPLVTTNGTLSAFDNVTFQNMDPAATQLTINDAGASVPATFSGLNFLTTPTTGFYISANDNVVDANTLAIVLTNSTPADGSAFTQTSGGAVVSWPAMQISGPMVFTSQADGENNEIWLRSADGVTLTQLTSTAADSSNWDPEWSPDGTQIVFAAFRNGENDHVHVMDADGSNQRVLTIDLEQHVYPSWSPDGTQIVFARGTGAGRDIWIMDSDGLNATELMANGFEDSQPDWSPDGSEIAYFSDRTGTWQIFTITVVGGVETNISNSGAVNDYFPHWSPDGSQIAFVSDRDGNNEIYVMDADGSNQTRLTNNAAIELQPTWTPDGTQILFTTDRDGGDQEVYIMNADGSNQRRVTNIAGPDQFPDLRN